jgi:hypothetical protein
VFQRPIHKEKSEPAAERDKYISHDEHEKQKLRFGQEKKQSVKISPHNRTESHGKKPRSRLAFFAPPECFVKYRRSYQRTS